ncbi:MAG: peptidylprolyl isomerase [Saprospiraceae bacterium]|nr:peptidylprolyl isomerase [Saprospiraceae bacterium]
MQLPNRRRDECFQISLGSQFYIAGKNRAGTSTDGYGTKKIKYTSSARDLMMQGGGTPQLDQEYTVFGQVIDGLKLLTVLQMSKLTKKTVPVSDVKILKN